MNENVTEFNVLVKYIKGEGGEEKKKRNSITFSFSKLAARKFLDMNLVCQAGCNFDVVDVIGFV